MKKLLITIIVLVIVVLLAVWIFSPVDEVKTDGDVLDSVDSDLQSLNINDLDEEFQNIDKDLETL